MRYRSVFDLIGPIMIGPSSSHTAGAVRLGQIARMLYGDIPSTVDIHFYGSFSQTYKGHATDIAIVGGLLNFPMDDSRIKNSLDYAKQQGIVVNFIKENDVCEHPNTVKMVFKNSISEMCVTGVSLGGGSVAIKNIDGFPISLSGESPAILILHQDAYGAIASVTSILSEHEINIGHMEVSRSGKGQNALMLIETDQVITESLVNNLLHARHVKKVMVLEV